MNKKVLTEVNRVLEIMGLDRSLLLEQGRLMTRLLSYGARSADEWWIALQKSLRDDSIYKKFQGKIPLNSVLADVDFTAVLELVLSKTPNATKRRPKLMGPQLRGLGLDVTDEIAGKIGKETVNTVKNPSKSLTLVLADITGESAEEVTKKTVKKTAKNSVDTKKLFSKLGKESTGEIAPLRKSLEVLISGGQKNIPIEDIQKFLTDLKLPKTDVDAWIKALKKGDDISEVADIKKIFNAALGNNNYRGDLLKTIEGNSTWQKWAQEADFNEKRIAKLLGLDVGDELATVFYNILKEKKWFKRWIAKQAKKGLASKIWGFVWKFLAFAGTVTVTLNWLFGSKYLKGDKQKEGIAPDMYKDIMTNKEMVVDEGGYTDKEAQEVAQLIYNALNESEYYKNDEGKYITDLEVIKAGKPKTLWIGSADVFILELYEAIPTVLACSQVAYWYETNHGPKSLKSVLESGMLASMFINAALSRAWGDLTLTDILIEIDTKNFCLTCQSDNTQKGYRDRVKANWPQYQEDLEDKSVDPPEVYYTRLIGPMDIAVLGRVLSYCNANTGKDMTSCLINIGPREFNQAWAEEYSKGTKAIDPYSKTYDPADAVDMDTEWDTQFRNLLGHEEEEQVEPEEGESNFDNYMDNTEITDGM